MIPYAAYKLVHYLGIFSLVAVVASALARGARPAEGGDPWRRRLGMLHGVALFLVLLGGFGMLARLGVDHGVIFPGWVWVKLAIWLFMGGLIMVSRRSPAHSVRALILVPLLAALAGLLAFTKPF